MCSHFCSEPQLTMPAKLKRGSKKKVRSRSIIDVESNEGESQQDSEPSKKRARGQGIININSTDETETDSSVEKRYGLVHNRVMLNFTLVPFSGRLTFYYVVDSRQKTYLLACQTFNMSSSAHLELILMTRSSQCFSCEFPEQLID